MKKALFIIFIIVLLVGGISYTFIMGAKKQETTAQPVQPDVVATFPVNEDGVDVRQLPTLPVTGTDGTEYKADNFLSGGSVVADNNNPGSFFLGNTFEFGPDGSTPSYVISYIYETDYFNITLLKQPFSIARSDAESYLKDLLMISKEDMCNLNYTVGIPQYASDVLSGKDLRFSFCSGAVSLD
jgi:hypothetical protein